uniref:Uncharacterized protein n=1 Tax=Timema shepardi TaxID=629360 RepID=A0A7R9G5T8_TIMSH|nr:unnamed protein product [Timema shepardi]
MASLVLTDSSQLTFDSQHLGRVGRWFGATGGQGTSPLIDPSPHPRPPAIINPGGTLATFASFLIRVGGHVDFDVRTVWFVFAGTVEVRSSNTRRLGLGRFRPGVLGSDPNRSQLTDYIRAVPRRRPPTPNTMLLELSDRSRVAE